MLSHDVVLHRRSRPVNSVKTQPFLANRRTG
jgi:hypothetical protein